MSGDERASSPLRPTEQMQFGKLPREVIVSGALRSLRPSELAVYTVIAAHICNAGWMAYPSIATIARCAGFSERQARRAVIELEKRGLLTIEHGGGRKICNRYTLTTKNPDTCDVTVSSGKPCQKGSETLTNGGLNPVIALSPE